jgi:hypothetical protein
MNMLPHLGKVHSLLADLERIPKDINSQWMMRSAIHHVVTVSTELIVRDMPPLEPYIERDVVTFAEIS